MNPENVIEKFNECINNRHLEGLAELMAEDHVFIDKENNILKGKKLMIQVWSKFFNQFPDYQNHFLELESKEDKVFVIGNSTCKAKKLDGPALWTAIVRNGLVKEWRVYHDSPKNRKKLSLKT
jgi:ketosteroid isomerase-like protein